jgi:uncharacterized protein involved in outer membrane biogenesis
MKNLKRILLVLLLVIIVGVSCLYFYRNSLIRSAVERQANSSLGVKTTLGSAHLGIFGGTLSLGDLKIGSPTGFTADQMFTLNELGLGVNYGELRKAPVHINKITIDKPSVMIEMVDGKFNFQALMNQMNSGAPPATKDGKPTEPVKLIIDELTLKDAVVQFKAAKLLPKEITVNIPSVTLSNIGNADGAQNGAAIKDVVGAMMSALAASASNSDLLKNFGDFDKILGEQANQVMGKISKQLGDQVSKITGNLTGQIDKAIGGAAGDTLNKTLQNVTGGKDPAKAVTDGLGGLLGGKKDKDKDKKK